MSWAVYVTDGSGYATNGLRFRTIQNAMAYGRNLLGRWMAARHFVVVSSPDPIEEGRWGR